MSDDGYSEKRKRSWREIDKMRDGTQKRERKREEERQSRAAQSAAYQEYKRQLESFFSGEEVPDALKGELKGVRAGGIFPLLAKIKSAATREELKQAVTEFKTAGYEFPPNDEDLMVKLLEHPDEQIQLEALRLLEQYLDQGNPCPHRDVCKKQIELIALVAEDEELAELAEELKERL